jgi:hypothetical protein
MGRAGKLFESKSHREKVSMALGRANAVASRALLSFTVNGICQEEGELSYDIVIVLGSVTAVVAPCFVVLQRTMLETIHAYTKQIACLLPTSNYELSLCQQSTDLYNVSQCPGEYLLRGDRCLPIQAVPRFQPLNIHKVVLVRNVPT